MATTVEKSTSSSDNSGCGCFYPLFCLLTAMVGYSIHGSVWWSIVDFFLAPFVVAKWLIMHQVNMTIIKETFSFFLK